MKSDRLYNVIVGLKSVVAKLKIREAVYAT